MRSYIFRPSGIHTPWNKLIMIMLNYQKQNLPSWILWGCPGTVSHLFIDTGFMACFFSTTASALAIEADAVLRDPRCLNERCPVLGQGSWTCCLNQLKRSERFIGFIVGKQRVAAQYMQKLIPNITVLKMPFAFPQMNLCLASHSSKLENFCSHLRQLQLDLQKFNLKNKIRIGWYGRWCTRTAIPKLGRNQQSTTFSLQHSFPQKLWRVRQTKTKGRWIFVDWFPRSSKFCRYNLPTISECTLNIPQFSKKTSS